MAGKRVEILALNVHTSIGKVFAGMRITLPRKEADQLIEKELARGVRGARPVADEPPMTVDVPGVDPTNLDPRELSLDDENDENEASPEQTGFDIGGDSADGTA